MRRGPLVLLTLLTFTALASAQTSAPVRPNFPLFVPAPTATAHMSPEAVVARMMSFDRNNDGRVAKDELPERMHNLLSGDTGGDEALDSAEVRELAMAPAATATAVRRGGFPSGGYTFGDQISLSSRDHVEGALDDLRLSGATREQARAIVMPFMEALEADASAILLKELEMLLPHGELARFKTAFTRSLSSRTVNAVVRPDGTTMRFVMRGGPDLTMLLNNMGMPADRTRQALDALEGFKARIRPGNAERAELLEQLNSILSDEERDNLRAALERRPLIKAGPSAQMFTSVQQQGMSGVVTGSAVFIMPAPPEPPVLKP